MSISSFTIDGFRGFATAGTLNLAQPNGTPGSGLTILVGPNSGGKSTIVEGLRAVTANHPPSFTEGRRNKAAGDRVRFVVKYDNGDTYGLATVDAGGSETAWVGDEPGEKPRMYVLPSRRFFNPFFSKRIQERRQYVRQGELPSQRGTPLNDFSGRLFRVLQNRSDFDAVLSRVMHPVPDWTIDQAEGGQYYLKFNSYGQYHNSDGLGEGLVSLFFIVDAMYDSEPGEIIVIDEPELSLHPIYQERAAALLTDYSADRQIVFATHSAHFVNIPALSTGATVARVHQMDGSSVINHLSSEVAGRLGAFGSNHFNPHILGLDARKAFFLEDGVVLLEGQEDVVFFQMVLDEMAEKLSGSMFGWGVGGAGNMRLVTAMLRDLGFRRVVGILDGNVTTERDALKAEFPQYLFETIPADDIRTKPARPAVQSVRGLLNENHSIRAEHFVSMQLLLEDVNYYLSS